MPLLSHYYSYNIEFVTGALTGEVILIYGIVVIYCSVTSREFNGLLFIT